MQMGRIVYIPRKIIRENPNISPLPDLESLQVKVKAMLWIVHCNVAFIIYTHIATQQSVCDLWFKAFKEISEQLLSDHLTQPSRDFSDLRLKRIQTLEI